MTDMLRRPSTAGRMHRPLDDASAGLRAGGWTGVGGELGPFARFAGTTSLVLAMSTIWGGMPFLPFRAVWLVLLGALGVAVLSPQQRLRRLPVSIGLLLLIPYLIVSLTWSYQPDITLYRLEQYLPVVLGVMILAGVMALQDVIDGILLGGRIVLVASLIATAVSPATRTHAAADGGLPIDGWHGLFFHKNEMAPFLVFLLVTLLVFDRPGWGKTLSIAGVGVLLIGSQSATGLTTAMLCFGLYSWLTTYLRQEGRWSTGYVVTSLALGMCALFGVLASLASLLAAAGKDLTFTGRTDIWAAALDFIADEPVLGHGLGGLFWGGGGVAPSPTTAAIWRAIGFSVPHAHSGPLDLVLQLGIVGLVLFGLVFLSNVVSGARLLRQSPPIGIWILTVVVAQIWMSLSEPVFLGPWLMVLALMRTLSLRREAQTSGVELAPWVRR